MISDSRHHWQHHSGRTTAHSLSPKRTKYIIKQTSNTTEEIETQQPSEFAAQLVIGRSLGTVRLSTPTVFAPKLNIYSPRPPSRPRNLFPQHCAHKYRTLNPLEAAQSITRLLSTVKLSLSCRVSHHPTPALPISQAVHKLIRTRLAVSVSPRKLPFHPENTRMSTHLQSPTPNTADSQAPRPPRSSMPSMTTEALEAERSNTRTLLRAVGLQAVHAKCSRKRHAEEEPKILIDTSRRRILLRSMVHVLPIVATNGISYLSLTNKFVVSRPRP